jgi:hypothetical protein
MIITTLIKLRDIVNNEVVIFITTKYDMKIKKRLPRIYEVD